MQTVSYGFVRYVRGEGRGGVQQQERIKTCVRLLHKHATKSKNKKGGYLRMDTAVLAKTLDRNSPDPLGTRNTRSVSASWAAHSVRHTPARPPARPRRAHTQGGARGQKGCTFKRVDRLTAVLPRAAARPATMNVRCPAVHAHLSYNSSECNKAALNTTAIYRLLSVRYPNPTHSLALLVCMCNGASCGNKNKAQITERPRRKREMIRMERGDLEPLFPSALRNLEVFVLQYCVFVRGVSVLPTCLIHPNLNFLGSVVSRFFCVVRGSDKKGNLDVLLER